MRDVRVGSLFTRASLSPLIQEIRLSSTSRALPAKRRSLTHALCAERARPPSAPTGLTDRDDLPNGSKSKTRTGRDQGDQTSLSVGEYVSLPAFFVRSDLTTGA